MPPSNPQSDHWSQVIEARGPLWDLKVAEIWRYRDLIYLFVRRDFVAQYKQTILGPAWHIIQPLLTTVVFTIIFGNIAQISTEGVPPFIFYLAGTVIWTYFANVLTDTSSTFLSNAHIFSKVYFPRIVTPLSISMSKLIAFTIQYVFFLSFIIYYSFVHEAITPNLTILLTPVLVLMMAMLGLSVGLLVTAMTTRYRDLAVLVAFGVQLWMYASPVIYPLSALPAKWQFIASLNPVAPILEAFRYSYLGVGSLDSEMLIRSALIIVVLFIVSLLNFNRVERNFADTI